MTVRTWLIAMGIACAALGTALAAGALGSLDDDFGTNGVVVADRTRGAFREVARDASSRILTVGQVGVLSGDGSQTVGGKWIVQRFTASGALDATFATGGVFELDGALGGHRADAIAVEPTANGRIYVGGLRTWFEGRGKKLRSVGSGSVVCLDASGNHLWTRDTGTLYVNQLLLVPAGSAYDVIAATTSAVTVEGSGGGKGKKNRGGGGTSSRAITLLRYSNAGTLLSTVVDDVSTTHDDIPNSLVQDALDRIVVGFIQDDPDGGDDNWWGLTRYLANGTVDASFGVGGRILGHAGGLGDLAAIALDGDGRRIIAVGRAPTAPWTGIVVRYDESGTTADDFTVPTFGGKDVETVDVEVDSLGNILAVMWYDQADWSVSIARYTSSGLLDTSFGPDLDGLAETLDISSRDSAGPVVLDGSDRIVMAGLYIDDQSDLFHPILVRWE